MDAQVFEQFLSELLEDSSLAEEGDYDTAPARIRTFEDEGVLTHDRGLVVKMADGSEFQITIVQSKEAN